jgi:hypothetical protein
VGAATVFGLDVVATRPLSFLDGSSAAATGRRLEVSLEPDERPDWPAAPELVCDERGPDGEVVFRIQRDGGRAYRFVGPGYGETVLAADGTHAWGGPDEAGLDGWQRFLVAQVLPFAAVLRGLEVLHASAVATAAGAVALLGPSGAGKTSLAIALERAGAGPLLADDVLALQRDGGETLVHPGAPIAAVAVAEAERLREAGAAPRGGLLATNPREEICRASLGDRPAQLRSLFFLDRRPDGPGRPRFEPEPDPRPLLASTFNLVLVGPRRLAALLDVCADLGRLRVERVSCGPEVDPGALAHAVGERLEATP